MIFKIIFDYILAIFLLTILGWVILLLLIISFFETKKWGFYKQERIGKNGKFFLILKIRTMTHLFKNDRFTKINTDKRITCLGKKIRKYKLDELPQLINILKGQMSFVGPRPDIKGYADKLSKENHIILSIKPGLTSPATLKYQNEEMLLTKVKNPKEYNDKIIWPDKIRMNKKYVENWSFKTDLYILYKTFIALLFSSKKD